MRSVAEPLAAAGAPIRELRLTGRSPAGDTWARIKADVLGVPVAIPAIADTAALGAAIVAAAGVGAVPSLEAGVAAMTSVVAAPGAGPGDTRAATMRHTPSTVRCIRRFGTRRGRGQRR